MKALLVLGSMLSLSMTEKVLEGETATQTEVTAFKVLAIVHFIFIGSIVLGPTLNKIRKELGINK